MKLDEIVKTLAEWDRHKKYVYTRNDLRTLFGYDSNNSLQIALARLVKKGILTHVARGVYVNALSSHIGAYTLYDIALTLRRGDWVYESLESALSQWGRISQILLDRVTFMTTGRGGEYRTPWGVVEFSHTCSDWGTINENIVDIPGCPVPLAKEDFALKNLKSVGRNLNMVLPSDEEDEYELIA